MSEESLTRVRINVSQSAKGIAQIDITAESPTVDESRDLFAKAIAAAQEEVRKAGLVLANEVK